MQLSKSDEQRIEKDAIDLIPVYPIGKTPNGWLRVVDIQRSAYQTGAIAECLKGLERMGAFAEWIKDGWIVVDSIELGKEAWVNCKENTVMVNGSDYHFTKLINEAGKSTHELITLYLNQLKKIRMNKEVQQREVPKGLQAELSAKSGAFVEKMIEAHAKENLGWSRFSLKVLGEQIICMGYYHCLDSQLPYQSLCKELVEVLKQIIKEPYGCKMCDVGVLRNKDKEHFDDCGFHNAVTVLTKASNILNP